MFSRKLRRLALAAGHIAGIVGLAAGLWIAAPQDAAARGWFADEPPAATAGTGSVALAELPPEARRTYALIRAGGPFPYDKDGVVFGNYERQLPQARRGYYREYTVPTPGARDRGPRRIVCGQRKDRTPPDACYYTQDHYASFRLIVAAPPEQR